MVVHDGAGRETLRCPKVFTALTQSVPGVLGHYSGSISLVPTQNGAVTPSTAVSWFPSATGRAGLLHRTSSYSHPSPAAPFPNCEPHRGAGVGQTAALKDGVGHHARNQRSKEDTAPARARCYPDIRAVG